MYTTYIAPLHCCSRVDPECLLNGPVHIGNGVCSIIKAGLLETMFLMCSQSYCIISTRYTNYYLIVLFIVSINVSTQLVLLLWVGGQQVGGPIGYKQVSHGYRQQTNEEFVHVYCMLASDIHSGVNAHKNVCYCRGLQYELTLDGYKGPYKDTALPSLNKSITACAALYNSSFSAFLLKISA